MINWKTILSSFDDKPTLMQWLKIVEKALQNASLESVTAKTAPHNAVAFEFKFADGSTVTSTAANLEAKGISGIEEVSDEVVGNQTLTTLRAHYTDGTVDEFPVYAENGAIYKHSLNINASINDTSTTFNIVGYFNYDKKFTLDTLKQYLNGKGQLSIYNRVGNNGIIYNLIAYNNNTQNVDILGYSFTTSINAVTLTITSINVDNVIKL